jgi:uncharacterized protein DUF4238
MPLDHYVSQVHLKNFYAPALGNRLHAIRKSDLKEFTPRAEDVCRIEDGSSNAYLSTERAIEDFLREIKPRYNASVAKLRSGQIDQETVYTVAGFAAFVSSCAPAAMRIHAIPLKSTVESTAFILDRQGLFPKAPDSLGGKSFTELLTDGSVYFDVDEKYPQALGINTIIQRVSLFGNSPWDLLHNDNPSSPFFTSDFPVAIEARGNSGIVNRIVPLTPDFAVRILPDVNLSRAAPDLSFAKFRCRQEGLRHAEVCALNRLIVQCAEDAVFYCGDLDWVKRFVSKNRDYRIQAIMTRVPYGRGFMDVGTQRIVRQVDGTQTA